MDRGHHRGQRRVTQDTPPGGVDDRCAGEPGAQDLREQEVDEPVQDERGRRGVRIGELPFDRADRAVEAGTGACGRDVQNRGSTASIGPSWV
ncbi:hypothetical protein GCM10009539_73400 [Cryptosporangium japonicum]|uniref:Uncharacterized protein n=1 Tax=Cryptosporangium japonicum TaxID=80872 RepID=A0ABN0V4J0_9ACTN